MNDLPRIGHLGGEPASAKVHEVVQIDGDVLLGGDAQDSVGAVVSAIGGVEDARRLEIHEQEGLCAAGELLGRNDAQNLGLYGIGTITTPLSTDLMILWANGSSSHSGEYVLLKYVDVL